MKFLQKLLNLFRGANSSEDWKAYGLADRGIYSTMKKLSDIEYQELCQQFESPRLNN